jgi:uncharacterized protein (TIGR00725 family)
LARKGVVVVCGGRGGVMEAVCKGAKEEGGITVGILTTYTGEDANPYVDIKVNTGMGWNRNPIVVASGEFVIAIGGHWGTSLRDRLRPNSRKKGHRLQNPTQ